MQAEYRYCRKESFLVIFDGNQHFADIDVVDSRIKALAQMRAIKLRLWKKPSCDAFVRGYKYALRETKH
jgi:hypothetical protein